MNVDFASFARQFRVRQPSFDGCIDFVRDSYAAAAHFCRLSMPFDLARYMHRRVPQNAGNSRFYSLSPA